MSEEDSAPLALPPPQDTSDAPDSAACTLDHLGPMIINSDGTISRIPNWTQLSPQEQQTALRRIAARNKQRIDSLKQQNNDETQS